MTTIPTPQAELTSLSFVGRDIDVINQFLSRFRSFSIGYGFLSISYGIVGITLLPLKFPITIIILIIVTGIDIYFNGSSFYDDQPYPNSTFLTFELLLSFFFMIASILLFQISSPSNIQKLTKIYVCSPIVPIMLSTIIIIIQIIYYKDPISVFILFINSLYSFMATRLLMIFHSNLDTFKETIRNIPIAAIANPLTTTLITTIPSTPSAYVSNTSVPGEVSTPSTSSAYTSPSETWTSVSTPLATATYHPPTSPTSLAISRIV
jgi:hypothetical protein